MIFESNLDVNLIIIVSSNRGIEKLISLDPNTIYHASTIDPETFQDWRKHGEMTITVGRPKLHICNCSLCEVVEEPSDKKRHTYDMGLGSLFG